MPDCWPGRGRPLGNLAGVELEQVVVAPAGRNPAEAGLLFATPGLFERLASWESAGARAAGLAVGGVLLSTSVPPPAAGSGAGPPLVWSLDELIARGEKLFFQETFNGNGRTCGTCHPAENNFTIDVPFIAALPANDPLFVAEGHPDLDSTLNGGLVFEDPILMRQFGLIVENLDGFGDLSNRYVMRSVQHTLGLAHTLKRELGATGYPAQRTGWSGDGSPGSGALRDFAVGAVTQHLPRTLARVSPADFRLPTPSELNALEAFQLSLGRPENPVLAAMTLLDAEAEAGKQAFLNGSCNACHDNGGALAFPLPAGGPITENRSFDTAIELFTQNHDDGSGQPRPVDGGFGTTPQGGFGALLPNPDGSFGMRTFNTPSLVEMADTLPAFHSNATLIPGSGLPNTVEGAVSFYTTPEFTSSTVAITFAFNAPDADRVARFLRVLNALENERSASAFGQRAEQELLLALPDLARVTRLASLAGAECEDAAEVLAVIGLHPAAVLDFQAAQAQFQRAMAGSVASRLTAIQLALQLLASAHADMQQ